MKWAHPSLGVTLVSDPQWPSYSIFFFMFSYDMFEIAGRKPFITAMIYIGDVWMLKSALNVKTLLPLIEMGFRILHIFIYLFFFYTRYRCSMHRTKKCKVLVTKDDDSYRSKGVDHNHANLETEKSNMKFKSDCKRRAFEENGRL